MLHTNLKIMAFVCILLFPVVIGGCSDLKQFFCEEKEKQEAPLVSLPSAKWPEWKDDLDSNSLILAASKSLEYLKGLSSSTSFLYGTEIYQTGEMIETLELFARIVETHGLGSDGFETMLQKNFAVYQAAGNDHKRSVLFTGYYEPVLEGSRIRTEDYTWPLYRKPDDLITINLEAFNGRLKGERIIARYEKGKVLPYYRREEIDTDGVLRGKGYEILWVKNAIEAFFLQIQGSGQIRISEQETLRVGFEANNGHPYRSIGRYLIEEGLMQPDDVSLASLKGYLLKNPSQRMQVFNYNPSYVFFHILDKGPLGSLNVELTSGRSIATDNQIFPRAGLAYLVSKLPLFDEKGELIGWRPFTRFVLNQDTGSAIKGPGRVDLFWGSGRQAELAAGYMRQDGRLYFLTKRRSN